MFNRLRALSHLFRARLSWRIVRWVFVSIVAIEAIILIPSVVRRERELLVYLERISTAKVSGMVSLMAQVPTGTEFLSQLERLMFQPVVVGGVLYHVDGQGIGAFGEPPELSFNQVKQHQTMAHLSHNGSRYDAVIEVPSRLANRYILILRHDARPVREELYAFIGRIGGLVLIISVFVTLATMIVLEPILITPIMLLRQDLVQAGKAIRDNLPPPTFHAKSIHRQDELGEVIIAFNQMFHQILEAIAERKEAEKALERLAEIGERTAMIVHEVRNPLTTMMLGLNSFEQLDLPDRARLRLSLALDEAGRLQRLLNEILLYAKRQTLQLTKIEMNAFMAAILDAMQTIPAAQGRQLEVHPSSVPAWVLADKDKLKQVLFNLAENACEAVSEGDRITWQVDCSSLSGPVAIWIQNGGNPIPPDILPKLTQPFYTTKPSGNGLGLAIVERIVEGHGGRLTIESDAIAGTKVTIHLPAPS